MKIQVLGGGCANCKKLYEMTKAVAEEGGICQEVEYIPDAVKMVEMGIMRGPALVIDGQVAVAGRVPSADELRTHLKSRKLIETEK